MNSRQLNTTIMLHSPAKTPNLLTGMKWISLGVLALNNLLRFLLVAGDSFQWQARSVLKAQNLLIWGSNPVEGNTEKSIAAMISVATLLGPEGPIPAPDVRLGLFYMRPESYYPLHLHDADETYAIIAGQALWTAGDDIRMRGAGEMIHHPSLMPHAFRTGSEGFLAIWRWSGDINTHSYAFIEDQATVLQVAAQSMS